MKEFNKTIIDEFHANGGVVGGQFAGIPLLLLTTTGAKTGHTRVNPLAYMNHGDRHIIIASYAGAPTNPPWYYNLLSNPEVSVEMGSERFTARADVLDEPERTELYAKMVEIIPVFSEYQSKTTRVIPVVALTRSE
ncbi:MAG: nitroreductase family deazaflavin-dependent oxidoreductase [Gammaproteobacteria bacterium]|nr:nitroreductase family deazaflavin-dependent oxidoreductase [Gammaproteobacteria bacterium]